MNKLAGPRWYAVHVRQRCEKVASTALRNRGLREFLPLYSARRQWSDRIAQVEMPLFPGYVFCHFDLADRRIPVLSTPGVLGLVGSGRTPLPVDDGEIAAVQTIVDSGMAAEPWPYLETGAAVRLHHGALAGLEGVFVEAKKHHRLVVSVTLLRRAVAVEIDSAWVSPVERVPWRVLSARPAASCRNSVL
ncbi:MAG: UpxY family transcription antiterminator [Bryobacteraceae bacterium]